jgi:hypothetical protein
MQQPLQPQDQFPQVHGMMSATLSQHRAITEQADFLRLLETKYGATKQANGTYTPGTYEKAIENYLDDMEQQMEQQRRERSASIAEINEERQKKFRPKQEEDAARFQHNFRMGHPAKPEEPEKPRGWSSRFQDMFDKAKGYARSARSHPYSQQHSEKPHARGGPPGMSKAEALVIMGFEADENPDYDILKQKFRKLALQFHPDKNIGKSPDEITKLTSKLEEMRKAFEFLKENETSDSGRHGGGIIKRRHKRHKTSKKTRRNSRRKTRRKTHRKTHRNSNKRR